MCEILKPLPQELENDIFKMSHEMQFSEVVDEMKFQFCGMDFSTACKRGCKSNTDIRCRCQPNCLNKNSMKQFNVCPQKISTLIYIIDLFKPFSKINYYTSSSSSLPSFH